MVCAAVDGGEGEYPAQQRMLLQQMQMHHLLLQEQMLLQKKLIERRAEVYSRQPTPSQSPQAPSPTFQPPNLKPCKPLTLQP
jgi:hypothetical protein